MTPSNSSLGNIEMGQGRSSSAGMNALSEMGTDAPRRNEVRGEMRVGKGEAEEGSEGGGCFS
jgi:hypothetical protein